MENVIVILGPTASGKTKLSIELAKEINGEIISADSMQVYKYMDIGTAKPTKDEMQGIRHYLIDEIYPDELFSVAKYQKLALKYISEILQKGKVPIMVGGTGLYIKSVVENISFTETSIDIEFRKEMGRIAEEKGNSYLHKMLEEIDPEAASRIHENDVKRIIRAIEVFRQTNKTITEVNNESKKIKPIYNFNVFGLTMDRQNLYQRIDKRVDMMIEAGLEDEVKKLLDMGYGSNTTAMQALGYKEIILYLNGEISFDEAIYIIKRDTRRYAKRQLTWFRHMENVTWLDVDYYNKQYGENSIKKIIDTILQRMVFSSNI